MTAITKMCKRFPGRQCGYQFREHSGTGSRNNNPPFPYRQRESNGQSHQRQSRSYHHNQRNQQQPKVWQDQGFSNQTVQPQLEAIMQAIFKQQQELTRITVQEITSKFGNNGVGMISHPPSTY